MKYSLGAAAMLSLALLAHPAAAQTTKKKAPTPKAAASAPADKTATLGTGKPGGRVLTKDELRACLKTQADQKTKKTDYDTQSAALDRDRESLMQLGESLKTELSILDRTSEDSVAAYNAKAHERDRTIDEWNARRDAVQAQSKKWNEDQADWTHDCADRRYREDDETAIRQGK